MLDFEKFKKDAINSAIESKIKYLGLCMNTAFVKLSSKSLPKDEKNKELAEINRYMNTLNFLLGVWEGAE